MFKLFPFSGLHNSPSNAAKEGNRSQVFCSDEHADGPRERQPVPDQQQTDQPPARKCCAHAPGSLLQNGQIFTCKEPFIIT